MKFQLLFLFFINQFIFAQNEQKRIALIVGNAEYLYGSSLKNPVNDIDLMEATLLRLGFEVHRYTNINYEQFNRAVSDYSKSLAQYDVTLFYYAGHAAQTDGINYLIPTDSRPLNEHDLKFEAISTQEVVKRFTGHKNAVNIVILDACRDNPFRSLYKVNRTGLNAMNPPSGTIIAFATSAGETADDGSNKNGLYTLELTKQMLIPQRIEDVFINTRNEVEKQSGGNQSPQEWSKLKQKFFLTEFTSIINNSTFSFTDNKLNANSAQRSYNNARSGLEMINIKGGVFLMGSPSGKIDEQPAHKVKLNNYSLSRHEVTNKQFCKFLNYIGCPKRGKYQNILYIDISSSFCQIAYKKGYFYPKENKADYPVVELSWYGATAYCKWMGGRLPTEAEWEYAASSGFASNENSMDKTAWFNKNAKSRSHPVGQKKANHLGLFDMNGNVWEWCSDWYDKNYYEISPMENPENKIPYKLKVLKGGSWKNTAYSCRRQTRHRFDPEKSANNIGFRVCVPKNR